MLNQILSISLLLASAPGELKVTDCEEFASEAVKKSCREAIEAANRPTLPTNVEPPPPPPVVLGLETEKAPLSKKSPFESTGLDYSKAYRSYIAGAVVTGILGIASLSAGIALISISREPANNPSAKMCRIGKQCGNSCIHWQYECHIANGVSITKPGYHAGGWILLGGGIGLLTGSFVLGVRASHLEKKQQASLALKPGGLQVRF